MLSVHIFCLFFNWISNAFLIDLQKLCVFGKLVFCFWDSDIFPVFCLLLLCFRLTDFACHQIYLLFYSFWLLHQCQKAFHNLRFLKNKLFPLYLLFISWFNFLYLFTFILLFIPSGILSNVRCDMQIELYF